MTNPLARTTHFCAVSHSTPDAARRPRRSSGSTCSSPAHGATGPGVRVRAPLSPHGDGRRRAAIPPRAPAAARVIPGNIGSDRISPAARSVTGKSPGPWPEVGHRRGEVHRARGSGSRPRRRPPAAVRSTSSRLGTRTTYRCQTCSLPGRVVGSRTPARAGEQRVVDAQRPPGAAAFHRRSRRSLARSTTACSVSSRELKPIGCARTSPGCRGRRAAARRCASSSSSVITAPAVAVGAEVLARVEAGGAPRCRRSRRTVPCRVAPWDCAASSTTSDAAVGERGRQAARTARSGRRGRRR